MYGHTSLCMVTRHRLTLGGKRLNRVGYDGRGTLGWMTSGIVCVVVLVLVVVVVLIMVAVG